MMKGAEGDRDYFGVLRGATHEDGAKEIICMPAICYDEVSLYFTFL
jgi:hypothetical protein